MMVSGQRNTVWMIELVNADRTISTGSERWSQDALSVGVSERICRANSTQSVRIKSESLARRYAAHLNDTKARYYGKSAHFRVVAYIAKSDSEGESGEYSDEELLQALTKYKGLERG